MTHGTDEELLAAGREPDPRRRRLVLLLVAVLAGLGAIVAVVVAVSSGGDEPFARPAPSSAPAPSDGLEVRRAPQVVVSAPHIPGRCPQTVNCRGATTPARVVAAYRAAIAQAFGRPSQLRTFTRERADGRVYSRTVLATVDYGTVQVLVTADPRDDQNFPIRGWPLSNARATARGYHLTGQLNGTEEDPAVVPSPRLARLLADPRLLAGL
ncbi:hypothetical protein [Jatrophihabitans fulvus]